MRKLTILFMLSLLFSLSACSKSSPNSLSTKSACAVSHGLEFCITNGVVNDAKTSMSVEAKTLTGELKPGDLMLGLAWQGRETPIIMKDQGGNVFPMSAQVLQNQDQKTGNIVEQVEFAPLPLFAGHTVKLTIPAFVAQVDLNQTIQIDLGSDPMPNANISIDADISVLGNIIHFQKARLIGDGINSLRLYLDSEPIESVDGIRPIQLEPGKPEKINDLYGSGMLEGSKDVFVELITPSGKITGILTMPIIRATVLVEGPFEFSYSFPASGMQTITPSPIVSANSPTESVIPTTSLDNHYYSGQPLTSGDLLYSVWADNKTNVYVFSPTQDTQPILFATLPGQASFLHLHSDGQGFDYLAGSYNPENNDIKQSQLYTLTFDDSKLSKLPIISPGHIFWPTWSSDGHLVAFEFKNNDLTNSGYNIGWIDINCQDKGECPVQILPRSNEFELYRPVFSPEGYRLAINGANLDTGTGDIYTLEFDANRNLGPAINFTNTKQYTDYDVKWLNNDTIIWRCEQGNVEQPTKAICKQGINSNSLPTLFTFDDYFTFGVSDLEKYFWTVTINRDAGRQTDLWLHDGTSQTNLGSGVSLDLDYFMPAFSPDEQYLAYVLESKTLYFVNLLTGEKKIVQTGENRVSWILWVP